MNPYLERIKNGLLTENPALVLMLGMCPTLAVTTSAANGFGMGVSTMVVLVMGNLIISLMRKIIPDSVRLPAFIVIVASLVTVVELVTQAYLPSLYASLGLYIPLIVVNCIILGRAEAYASKNTPLLSIFDGIGMGLGFTAALVVLGLLRELLGAGTAFGIQIMPKFFVPIAFFTQAPGAFLVLALIVMVLNAFKVPNRGKQIVEGCDGCCATCATRCKTEKEEAKAS